MAGQRSGAGGSGRMGVRTPGADLRLRAPDRESCHRDKIGRSMAPALQRTAARCGFGTLTILAWSFSPRPIAGARAQDIET
ncbi:hypothetical protein Rumeso_00934 [Rubellimicrobium mesophilum DSM 19309]|uniref:Uncharacterized protein n=1 Tax=Rubellimicrobium mesophilum DSM 19309 TaxID=442562 RepID=A0A017HUT5_9RHOB|nr:hypothetical protein Rumeso_00934 [Rubellimicrobium mesophilum DSM 19309]